MFFKIFWDVLVSLKLQDVLVATKLCTHYTVSGRGRTFPLSLSHLATTDKVDIVWYTVLTCSNYSVLLHAILILVLLMITD